MILSGRNSKSTMEGCVADKRFNFNDATASTPLSAIAEAFEEVEKLINLQKINGAQQFQLRLDTLCEACSPISILFRCLGLAFKFAELEYVSKDAASTAYAQVCAPYHSWTVRTAVAAGMYTLPPRQQLLLKLNETNHSAEKKMKRYIRASLPVIQYIDKLYLSRNIKLDW